MNEWIMNLECQWMNNNNECHHQFNNLSSSMNGNIENWVGKGHVNA